MLIKSKLLQIEPKPCPKIKVKQNRYGGETYKAAIQIVDGIVVIDLYKTTLIPSERFFADGKTWQFYDVKNNSWSQKTNSYYSYSHDRYYCENIPEEVFDILKTPVWTRNSNYTELNDIVSEYTTGINAAKRRRYEDNKHERIRKIVDKSIIFPKGLDKWYRYNAKNRYSMILPKNGKSAYTVKCLVCGNESEVNDINHKSIYRCPKCGKDTTAYLKRTVTSIKDKEKIAICRKTKGAIAVSGYELSRTFDAEGTQNTSLIPFAVFHEKDAKATELYNSFHSYKDFDYARYRIDGEFLLYTPSIKKAFKDGRYKGINISRMKGRKVQIFRILEDAQAQITKDLCKIGCYNLAAHTAELYPGRTFSEVTGLNPNYITEFRKNDYGISLMHKLREFGGYYNSEQLKKLDIIPNPAGKLKELRNYMSDTKLINYFYKQTILHPEQKYSLYDQYIDYIGALKTLKKQGASIDMDASIMRFPRDLPAAHDKHMEMIEIIKCREKDEAVEKLSRKYQKIPCPPGKLIILHPTCKQDFLDEGKALHHCVGNNNIYYDNQATAEYMTFFIRKKDKPEEPYFTATFYIDKDEVRYKECYGLKHKTPTDSLKEFIEKYRKKVEEVLGIKERNEAA